MKNTIIDRMENYYGKGSVFRVEFPQGIVDESPVGSLSSCMNPAIHKENKSNDELLVRISFDLTCVYCREGGHYAASDC